MSDTKSTIQCTSCGETLSITEALTSDIEARFEKKFQAKVAKAEAELKASLEKKVKAELLAKSRLEMDDLKAQLEESAKSLEDAKQAELELRKRARDLEKREKDAELELERRLDEAKETMASEVSEKLVGEFRQKAAEKDKQIDGMLRQIEELKRKAEQGSQQTQGEVFELQIEAALKVQFPMDEIEPVGKGTKGADIHQKILTSAGQAAGTIIWEMKRTKAWSDGWISKLKDDQRAISAEFAVLVTDVMPKGARHLALVDGIWVVSSACYAGLAVALRHHVLQVHQARDAASGKGEKIEEVYAYLTGTRFQQRIEAIVEAFITMQDDLRCEKVAFHKIWAARERQLHRVMESTVGIHGDVTGIVGSSLPRIARLELPDQENIKAIS